MFSFVLIVILGDVKKCKQLKVNGNIHIMKKICNFNVNMTVIWTHDYVVFVTNNMQSVPYRFS